MVSLMMREKHDHKVDRCVNYHLYNVNAPVYISPYKILAQTRE